MQTYQASISGVVKAPANQVYTILADYHNGHPNILPKQYFSKLSVEQGGRGAGTELRFEMQIFGRTQRFHTTVSEPEPGRVLVERNLADSSPPSVTTFTVDPIEGGKHAQVTIQTEGQTRAGLAGKIEAFFAKQFLQRVYKQEMALLASYAVTSAVEQKQA